MEGRSFVEAFTNKYLDQDDDYPTELKDEESGIVILCPKTKPGEFSQRRRIVLDNEKITSAGDCRQIAENLGKVRELDLSANQLSSWDQVEEILKFMPDLEFLNLASTLLSDSKADSVSDTSCPKEHVKILILNSTRIPWDVALRVLATFPNVEEVHLSLNNFSSIPKLSTPTTFNTVRRLYFNDNGVGNWSELVTLGKIFPNTESLFLVKNPLTGLTENIGQHFGQVRQLSILDTSLSLWDEIDNLNHFPKLVEIQLRGIPLVEGMEEKEYRQLIVARLAKVTKLNNSPISESERENAERFFIRRHMDTPNKPKRYEELTAVHKNVNKLAHVNMGPITNASLMIRYGSTTVEMDVSTEQTCWQLKKSLAAYFKVSHEAIQLYYHDGRYEGDYDEMQDDQANLQWYSMKDGDEILIKDAEVKAKPLGKFWMRQRVCNTPERSNPYVKITAADGQTGTRSKWVRKVPESSSPGNEVSPTSADNTEKQPVEETTAGEPCTFVEAFTKKYLVEDEDQRTQLPDCHIVIACPKRKIGGASLTTVILYQQNMTSAGDCQQIADKLANVRELDLTGSRLGSWTEVDVIIQHMPRLEMLTLAAVTLSGPTDTEAIRTDPSRDSVKLLVLTGTHLPWATATDIIASFPSLQEVRLSMNNYSTIPETAHAFPNIRQLYLNDNRIEKWPEIAALGKLFPNLEYLSLINNPLSGLTEDIGSHFGCLKQLSLLDTGLSTWDEVDHLNHFPQLVEIQLQDCQLLKDAEPKEARELLIARLAKVTRLNKSPVFESERETAERNFIRKFMDAPEKPRRYEELRQIHKDVHRLVQIELMPTKRVTLTIKFQGTSTEMTLSTKQTLWELKKHLAKHFGLPTSKTRLFYLDKGMNFGLEELRAPTANLYRYNMNDGDEIVVERRQ